MCFRRFHTRIICHSTRDGSMSCSHCTTGLCENSNFSQRKKSTRESILLIQHHCRHWRICNEIFHQYWLMNIVLWLRHDRQCRVFVKFHYHNVTIKNMLINCSDFRSIYSKDIISVGGSHIKPVKPLPEDIKKFIDEAKHGVIYFSLGTVVKTSQLPTEKIAIFIGEIYLDYDHQS